MEEQYTIKQILERYYFSDPEKFKHFSEIEELKLSSDFFQILIKMFEDENYFPKDELMRYKMTEILDYIKRTHQYYLEKKLPEIAQNIELLLSDYSDKHPLLPLLRRAFHNYHAELTKHIKAEDSYLLPYIERLLESAAPEKYWKSKPSVDFTLSKFISQHSDTESDLEEMREIISYYAPPATNQTPYRILLNRLEKFENDLRVHALIEDKVLVPKALQLELSLLLREKCDFSLN